MQGPRFSPWSGTKPPHAATIDSARHNQDPVQTNKQKLKKIFFLIMQYITPTTNKI